MNIRSHIFPIAFLGTLFLSGCVGTPQIETSVYEGPNGSVMLKTISEASSRPSHPVDVSVETFSKVLTGIHYRRSAGRWLQRLLDSGAKSSPLLSPTQVAFLAPHLRRAFLQVTAEERVLHPYSFTVNTGVSKPDGQSVLQGERPAYGLDVIGPGGPRPSLQNQTQDSQGPGSHKTHGDVSAQERRQNVMAPGNGHEPDH